MFDGECEGTCFFWSMNWCISLLINLRGQCPRLCDFPILKTWYVCQTLKPCDFTVKFPGRPTKIKTTKGIGCNCGGDKSTRWFLSQQASFQNWSYQKQKAGPSPLRKRHEQVSINYWSECFFNLFAQHHAVFPLQCPTTKRIDGHCGRCHFKQGFGRTGFPGCCILCQILDIPYLAWGHPISLGHLLWTHVKTCYYYAPTTRNIVWAHAHMKNFRNSDTMTPTTPAAKLAPYHNNVTKHRIQAHCFQIMNPKVTR